MQASIKAIDKATGKQLQICAKHAGLDERDDKAADAIYATRLTKMQKEHLVSALKTHGYVSVDVSDPLMITPIKAPRFVKRRNSAKAFFDLWNGERHARIHELRKLAFTPAGRTRKQDAEFKKLYREEAAWLKKHSIQYDPSFGWHFTTHQPKLV